MLQLSKDEFKKQTAAETDFDSIAMDVSTEDPLMFQQQSGEEGFNVQDNPRFRQDAKLYVQFYSKPRRNNTRSRIEKRPIFDNATYIKINVPGDKHNEIDRPADHVDIARFSQQYARFQKGQSQDVGIPLSVAGFLPENVIEELKHFHVRTVEQLANLSDANAQRIFGGQDLKQNAKKYLELATGAIGFDAHSRELDNQKQQINQQAQEIADLQATIRKLSQVTESAATAKPPTK